MRKGKKQVVCKAKTCFSRIRGTLPPLCTKGLDVLNRGQKNDSSRFIMLLKHLSRQREDIMAFTKLSWGMAAFAVTCQLAVTAVLVAVFTFHPALAASLPVHEDAGAPVAVTYAEKSAAYAVDWELSDTMEQGD